MAKVAGIAARCRSGVYSFGSVPSRALGAIRDAVGSSDHAAGVRAEVGETQVAVDISLVAVYGTPLHSLADQVRAAVYRAVEELVGLQVIEVNVEITDVLRGAAAEVGCTRRHRKGGPAVNLTVVGIAVGAFVAFMSFQFGLWGFLVALLFMAIGALLGRAAEGKLDLRSVFDAIIGRRSSS